MVRKEERKPGPEAAQPIDLLMGEHRIILHNLEQLRSVVGQVKAATGFSDIRDELGRLQEIAHLLLLDTESHYKREEEVLFPRLEQRGVAGPPRIMRLEHNELRPRKKRLAERVELASSRGFAQFVDELSQLGGYIADGLRDHIFRRITYSTLLP